MTYVAVVHFHLPGQKDPKDTLERAYNKLAWGFFFRTEGVLGLQNAGNVTVRRLTDTGHGHNRSVTVVIAYRIPRYSVPRGILYPFAENPCTFARIFS